MSYETNAYHNEPAKAEDLAAQHLPDHQPPATKPSELIPLTAEDMQRINEGRIAFGLDPFPFRTPSPCAETPATLLQVTNPRVEAEGDGAGDGGPECAVRPVTHHSSPVTLFPSPAHPSNNRQSSIVNRQSDVPSPVTPPASPANKNYETNPPKIEPAADSNTTVENTPKIDPETQLSPPETSSPATLAPCSDTDRQSPVADSSSDTDRWSPVADSKQPDPSDSSDLSDSPNAVRPTPNAFPPDRRSPVADSNSSQTISDAKLQANRENAKKSTGPKTKKGKTRSSRNAILHGLTSEKEINSAFDYKGEFKEFQHHIYRQLEPTNTLELALVDRLVSIMWRLRRIPSMETSLIDFHVDHQEPAAAMGRTEARSFTNIARYEAHLDRSLHRTLKELKEARETRRAVPYPCRSMKQIDEEERLWAIADEMNAEQDAIEAAYFAAQDANSQDSQLAQARPAPSCASADTLAPRRERVGPGQIETVLSPQCQARGEGDLLSPFTCADRLSCGPSGAPKARDPKAKGVSPGKSATPTQSPDGAISKSTSKATSETRNPTSEMDPSHQSLVASSDPAALAHPRERVGPGQIETVPSPLCQDRGEGELHDYQTSRHSQVASRNAECPTAHDSRFTAHESTSEIRHPKSAMDSSRPSPVASRDSGSPLERRMTKDEKRSSFLPGHPQPNASTPHHPNAFHPDRRSPVAGSYLPSHAFAPNPRSTTCQ